MTTEKPWFIITALNGFLAILMGTIAAHALSDPQAAHLAEKASHYELIHAVMLLALAGRAGKGFQLVRYLILFGMIFFCGSLYLKALSGWADAAMLAPLGGMSFMLGWLMLALVIPAKAGSQPSLG